MNRKELDRLKSVSEAFKDVAQWADGYVITYDKDHRITMEKIEKGAVSWPTT